MICKLMYASNKRERENKWENDILYNYEDAIYLFLQKG